MYWWKITLKKFEEKLTKKSLKQQNVLATHLMKLSSEQPIRVCWNNENKIHDVLHRMATSLENNDLEDVKQLIIDCEIACPVSGSRNWTDVRQFNLMFSTEMGSVSGEMLTKYICDQKLLKEFLSIF